MKTKSIVGDLINFRGLVYSPINESGVIFLFGKVAHDLNMYIEEIKPGFPDCTGRRYNGKGWERLDIEFEYRSSNFKAHKHDSSQCDMIICWEHDWKECPLEVIALKDVIPSLPNQTVERPDQIEAAAKAPSLESFLSKQDSKVIDLARKTIDLIRSISPEIWIKHNNGNLLTFYSPRRVFIYMTIQKKQLAITLFTRGSKIPRVEPFDYEYAGAKWGWLEIDTDDHLTDLKKSFRRSLELINEAVSEKEPTNWYAPLKQEN